MKILVILVFTFLLTDCSTSDNTVIKTYTKIKGTVVKDNNKEYLDSVFVFFKNPNIPDSLVFIGDSVIKKSIYDPDKITLFPSAYTYSNQGIFQFDLVYKTISPKYYRQMFAYKRGLKLWKYDLTKDTVYHLNQSIDSIIVRMQAE